MSTQRLSQIVALESSIKTKVNRDLTELYKIIQKPSLFNGHSRVFHPRTEDSGISFEPETVRIQGDVAEILQDVQDLSSELINVVASKDRGNTEVTANVVVDDTTILEDVPVPTLLFLEKELDKLRTLVEKLPELDPAETWRYDENSGTFKSTPTRTTRTQKVQKGIVLYDATEHHPAQTQLVSEDVPVGEWETTKLSSALPVATKTNLRKRIINLQNAVKVAREEANATKTETVDFGRSVMEYIFS